MERDNQFFRRLLADYERLIAPSSDEPLPLTIELWIQERLRTALDLVERKTGHDREGWIEDARYWRLIVERFSEPRQCHIQQGGGRRIRCKLVRDHIGNCDFRENRHEP